MKLKKILTISLLIIGMPTMAANLEISADNKTRALDGKSDTYKGDVRIFIPQEENINITSNNNQKKMTTDNVVGDMRIELSDGITLVITDGKVLKGDKGLKITTDYAELHSLTKLDSSL